MSKGVRLSHKHGLNPSMSLCFYCGETKEIVLFGAAFPKGEEAPRQAVYDKEPCQKCQEYLQDGIMFIQVKDGEQAKGGASQENPYRTGPLCVIKEDAVRAFMNGPLLQDVLKRRVCFIEVAIWEELGLSSPAEES